MERTFIHVLPQRKKSNNKACLIGVALISLLIFTQCKNNGTSSFKPSPPDTVKTVCLYQTPLNGGLAIDYAIRITFDTVKLVDGKAVKGRDSLWFTPFLQPQKKDGKDVLDSLGKPKMDLVWQPHPKKLIIHDYNANIPLK